MKTGLTDGLKGGINSDMILAPGDPESRRGFLKRRHFESWAIIISVFVGFVCLFAWVFSLVFESFLPMILGILLAGFIAYYVYLRLDRQPTRIRCDSCGGSVLCSTPWLCGECGHENWDVVSSPFISQCEECELEPKSYICHHCNNPIFLSEDHDPANSARRITTQGLNSAKRSESRLRSERDFDKKTRDLQQEYDQKKQSVESAKLDLLVEQIRGQIKMAKKGSAEASAETSLNIYFEGLREFMGAKEALDEAVRVVKLELAKKLKGNRILLRKRYAEVDEWNAREFANLTSNPTQK